MQLTKKSLALVFALAAMFASTSIFASIPRREILTSSPIDLRYELASPPPAPDDNARLLACALERALPRPDSFASLAKTRVGASDLLAPFEQQQPSGLTRAMRKASAFREFESASDETFCGGDPVNNSDPTGMAVGDWWDPRSYAGAVAPTLHGWWNVASLGTLDRVEKQKNLGTVAGVAGSVGHGVTRISNAASFGLQDSIYETQMREGPGLKSIGKGVVNGVVNLTPIPEIAALATNPNLSTEAKVELSLMAFSKTASLGAMALGGVRFAGAYQEAGSLRAMMAIREAQLSNAASAELGELGEAALSEIAPEAEFQVRAKAMNARGKLVSKSVNGKWRTFDGVEYDAESARTALEMKNEFMKSYPRQAFWDEGALQDGYLSASRWYLLRGGSPSVINNLTQSGIGVVNFGPLIPAWQVLHPGFGVLPAMQRATRKRW